jgi:hypothetical protein
MFQGRRVFLVGQNTGKNKEMGNIHEYRVANSSGRREQGGEM